MSHSLQDEFIKKELLHGAQNYSPLSVVLEKVRVSIFGMLMEINILIWFLLILL